MLQNYFYPGNVRELENMVERAVLMARGRVVMPEHLPARADSNGERDSNSWKSICCPFPFTNPYPNWKNA